MYLTSSKDEIDVRDFVLNKRNGVKGLVDFITLNTLPSPYIQPPQERYTSDKIISSQVPVIDVFDWLDPRVAREICDAVAELGVIQIVNHGIAPEELKAVIAAACGFFELPVEERKMYWKGSSGDGVVDNKFHSFQRECCSGETFSSFSILVKDMRARLTRSLR